ncbi:MAG TPA: glycosyltransferase family 2 protein [Anaerolineaceae bacterium]|nr:glycosyltransferase family 2 protein [Anaerolineaceae bacterium]HOH20498.1 glycosyltransferase family 2 protein [Anaerolineaceae bacterium]
MSDCFLSIVFPAHNEEKRLPRTLEQTAAFLQAQPYSAEIIVVENGSTDRTLAVAEEHAARFPMLRVIHEEQRGKGRAVRRGMLAARGEYRFFCDVDLSMPITEINRFFPPQLEGAEIVIASREAPGSVRYNEPAYRHTTGRVFNWMVKTLALPGIEDSQCGFKCFSASAAEALFPLQTIMGWSFDVELLYAARRRGLRIVELDIPWYFNPDSKIHVLRDSWRMFWDLLSIRWNGLRGRYQP